MRLFVSFVGSEYGNALTGSTRVDIDGDFPPSWAQINEARDMALADLRSTRPAVKDLSIINFGELRVEKE